MTSKKTSRMTKIKVKPFLYKITGSEDKKDDSDKNSTQSILKKKTDLNKDKPNKQVSFIGIFM